MKLFDTTRPRNSGSRAGFAEAAYSRLSRSASPEFEYIRDFLEDWYTRFPTAHQPELRARFRSPLNSQHNAAFFELLLHETLVRLDCDIEIHPIIKLSARSPDFHARSALAGAFYLEATIATFQSDEESAAQARLYSLYDVLNRHVDPTNFFIWVEIDRAPDEPPPARRIASFLNSHLRKIDPDEVAAVYEADGYDAVPSWVFIHEGWSVLFRPIPKKPEARGKPGVQPLGMFSDSVKQVNHRTPLRDSIAHKASAYGELEKPFVIAVNALEMIDDIDVLEALFGKEQFTIYFSEESPSEPIDTKPSRIPDGVWTNPSGPTYTRVSAVIVAYRLHPWSIGESRVRLFHNPWATNPYDSVLTKLPQAIPLGGKYEYVEGKSLSEILNISWPSELAG